jgi:multidrug efflux pump subunit AcrA (membrane-fusion protein)
VFAPGPGDEVKPVQVRLGLSDGRFIEVIDGLSEGAKVITGADDARSGSRPQPSASTNPFQPQRFQPRTR